ncbi:uncharacterized protein METZ01_LOCUS294015 [marine metagenome]|uniref:Uncharacterized protein n=1 Tax=marine metagenome TaxID=408172 RepID=A0A382M1X5_9ZZZZ
MYNNPHSTSTRTASAGSRVTSGTHDCLSISCRNQQTISTILGGLPLYPGALFVYDELAVVHSIQYLGRLSHCNLYPCGHNSILYDNQYEDRHHRAHVYHANSSVASNWSKYGFRNPDQCIPNWTIMLHYTGYY